MSAPAEQQAEEACLKVVADLLASGDLLAAFVLADDERFAAFFAFACGYLPSGGREPLNRERLRERVAAHQRTCVTVGCDVEKILLIQVMCSERGTEHHG